MSLSGLESFATSWQIAHQETSLLHSIIRIIADILKLIHLYAPMWTGMNGVSGFYSCSFSSCDGLLGLFGFLRTAREIKQQISALAIASYVKAFANIKVSSFALIEPGQIVRRIMDHKRIHWDALYRVAYYILRILAEILGDACYVFQLAEGSSQVVLQRFLHAFSLLFLCTMRIEPLIKHLSKSSAVANSSKAHNKNSSSLIFQRRDLAHLFYDKSAALLQVLRDLLLLFVAIGDAFPQKISVKFKTIASLAANILLSMY